jgi:ribosomal-protein-alanine N-acetyltransferase
MTIRPVTSDDVAGVNVLERALFGVDAWSESSVREELTGAHRRAVVAEVDGAIVGYAVTRSADDIVDLQRIAVAVSYRRAGLARRLLDAVRAAGRSDGAHRMLLEVSADNADALAFYAAEGFSQIDRRLRYYRDGSDALVLRAPLGGAACGGRAS